MSQVLANCLSWMFTLVQKDPTLGPVYLAKSQWRRWDFRLDLIPELGSWAPKTLLTLNEVYLWNMRQAFKRRKMCWGPRVPA